MKLVAAMIAALSVISTTYAQGQHTHNGKKPEPMQTTNDIRMLAPALEKYAQGPLADLWKRPGPTPRDRSIVTISALIARNQTIEMPYYFNLVAETFWDRRTLRHFMPLKVARPKEFKSSRDGDQKNWLAAFRERIVRVVHKHGPSRSAVSDT